MMMASARASRSSANRRVGGRSRPRASTSAVTRSGTAISQTRMCSTQPAPTSTTAAATSHGTSARSQLGVSRSRSCSYQLAGQPDDGQDEEEAVDDQEVRYLRPGLLVHLEPGVGRGVVFRERVERHRRHAHQDHRPPDHRDDRPEEECQARQKGRAVRFDLRPAHPGAADRLHHDQRGQPGQRIRREVPRVRRPQRAEHEAQQHDRQQIGQGDVPGRWLMPDSGLRPPYSDS